MQIEARNGERAGGGRDGAGRLGSTAESKTGRRARLRRGGTGCMAGRGPGRDNGGVEALDAALAHAAFRKPQLKGGPVEKADLASGNGCLTAFLGRRFFRQEKE